MLLKLWQFIFLLLMSIPALLSAVTGKITGTITDQRTLEPLIGANVLVVGTQTGAASNVDGNFIINDLQPGSYNVEIRYLGYITVKKNNVIVNPNRSTVLPISMESSALEGKSVEVSAGYFVKAKEAVVSTRSMDFEEIRRSPGDLVDIQRAVQALPSVVSGSDQMNEIIVRGGYPGENLFVMDNIEIPNPNHFAVQGAGGGPINLLNSYMVRNVDFYAGAFSARFGDRASSVMDISLRNGSRERLRWEGSMGMAGIGALIEGPVSQNGSFMFSARKSYLDLIISSTGLIAVPYYHNFQGKFEYTLNDANSLSVNAVYGSDHINIEGGDKAGYGRGAENVNSSNTQFISGATLRTFWSKRVYSNTTLSAVSSDFSADAYRMPGRRTFFENHSEETEYTAKTDVVMQAGKKLELNIGASVKAVQDRYDVRTNTDTLFVYNPSVTPPPVIGIFRINPEYVIDSPLNSLKTAFYSQAAFDFSNRLRVTGGLRYDYFKFTRFSSLSPRLGLSWRANAYVTLNAAYGRHFQSPYPVELAANVDNHLLRHKYTDQFVVGIDYLIRDDIKLTLEAYHKEYFDIPVRKRDTTPDPYDRDNGLYINAARGETRGFELFFQKKLTDKFSTIISYAHSDAKTVDPRSNDYYPADYDYRDVFTFIGGYKYRAYKDSWFQKMRQQLWYRVLAWLPVMPADEMELSIKWRYLGGRPYTEPIYHADLQRWVVEEALPLNTSRYPAYHRFDLRLDRRFLFNSWTLVVFFDLVNIYDQDNIWNYQYNDDGSVSTVNQYKTLPVGGVTLEF